MSSAILIALIVPRGFSTKYYVDYATGRERVDRRVLFVRVETTVRDSPIAALLSKQYLATAQPDWFIFRNLNADVFDTASQCFESITVNGFYGHVAQTLSDCDATDEAKSDAALAAINYARQLAVRGKGPASMVHPFVAMNWGGRSSTARVSRSGIPARREGLTRYR
ncbi:MAG: hypothetical protein ACREJD_06010 [Phycisphaerales bacterium]